MIKFLFVGRLDNPKDPITLLQAAQLIIQEEPSACFTLVGDGEKYDECKQFIEKNHLKDNINLAGWQSDVKEYYTTHQIFIASSIYEAFGLMFIEAGFFGLPVVATNVEGIPEVVEDKVTGLLSPPRNPALLARNAIELIRNEKLRNEMGEHAYKRVTSLFSSERMVKQYKKLYEE